MSVMIGQASIDETGKIVGGQAGNQSGRELNKSPWYKNGWTLVIRAKDPKIAEKMAQACEKGVANRKIGYDQASGIHFAPRQNLRIGISASSLRRVRRIAVPLSPFVPSVLA